MKVLIFASVIGSLCVQKWLEASVLLLLFEVSLWLETVTLRAITTQIGHLMVQAPTHAVLANGQTKPVDQIAIGTVLCASAGMANTHIDTHTHNQSINTIEWQVCVCVCTFQVTKSV